LKSVIQIPFFSAVLFFSSCVKDKPELTPSVSVNPDNSAKVYIINEGNFGSGNSSLSRYQPDSLKVLEDIYKTQNNQSLGDVAQSMKRIKDKYYIVVNNSGKIVICDLNFNKTGLITNLTSPRFIVQVNDTKAYVSDYKANALHIIDLSSGTKTGSVVCKGWTEEMLLVNNKVYVCNLSKKYLYVIDATKDQISDSILVGSNANGIVLDKDGKIWVLSSGDATFGPGRLSRINPVNNTLEAVLPFAAGQSPFRLCINGKKDSLYFLDNNVYRLSVYSAGLPKEAFVIAGTKNFYGLGIDPVNSDCYLSDALDYVQRSQISVYKLNGELKTQFKAGINSNGFYFE
jgi:DNA-binding beta-propeller fold protein YncE